MRTATILIALLLTSTALAQRPSTLSMSCAQARSFVASHGAVVMSTGAHTYDRFVSSPGYCLYGEYARTGRAPTRDSASCRIGYRCDTAPPLWKDGLFDIR